MKNGLNNNPIGIFDSGLGGLTVMKELTNLLPAENIIYFGDTARVPYGTKSKNVVRKFSTQITKFLVRRRVKLILVACNTASAVALDEIKRVAGNTPVIGVIKSGAGAAVSSTVKGKIGVIGTYATVNSNSYKTAIRKLDKKTIIYQQACPLFVPLVEEGWTDGLITKEIARTYLASLKKHGCDVIILGCTHYPMLKKVIREVTGRKIKLVDSAEAVSKDVKKILSAKRLLRPGRGSGRIEFYVSDLPQKFSKTVEVFLGKFAPKVKKVDMERYYA